MSWYDQKEKPTKKFSMAPTVQKAAGIVGMGNVQPRFSSKTLSLRPSFNSGMPDKNDFIFKAPRISEWSTVPLEDTSKLSFSTTW